MRAASRPTALLALVTLVVFTTLIAGAGQNQPLRSPFDALRFRDIGPAVTGGRMHDLQIDPKDPAVLYVAAATGGI